jgi:O-antigen/teichoic acid export membrane protein
MLGIEAGRPAVAAIVVLLAGNCLCTTAVAVLRGTGQVTYANLTSFAGFAVVPLVAFAADHRTSDFLLLYGTGMTAVAAAGAAASRAPAGAHVQQPARFAAVLRYGVRRLPGDLALPALFALPTFAVAVTRPGTPEVGYVGFTTSAVTLVCALFGMLTPVLLPRLSAHFHHGTGGSALHRALLLLPFAAGGAAALIALLIAVAAPWSVHHFLGEEFVPAVQVLRIGMAAAVPLAVFYAVRPTLDALHEAPVTARLVVADLALQLLLTIGLTRFLAVPVAAVLAFAAAAGALGLACLVTLRRDLGKRTA